MPKTLPSPVLNPKQLLLVHKSYVAVLPHPKGIWPCVPFQYIQNATVFLAPEAVLTPRFETATASSDPSNVLAPPYFPVVFTIGHAVPEQVPLFLYFDRSSIWEPFSPKALLLSKFNSSTSESL